MLTCTIYRKLSAKRGLVQVDPGWSEPKSTPKSTPPQIPIFVKKYTFLTGKVHIFMSRGPIWGSIFLCFFGGPFWIAINLCYFWGSGNRPPNRPPPKNLFFKKNRLFSRENLIFLCLVGWFGGRFGGSIFGHFGEVWCWQIKPHTIKNMSAKSTFWRADMHNLS